MLQTTEANQYIHSKLLQQGDFEEKVLFLPAKHCYNKPLMSEPKCSLSQGCNALFTFKIAHIFNWLFASMSCDMLTFLL